MVEVKASGNFDPQAGKLTISLQILPSSELAHEMLAALLDESEKPSVTVEYTNVRDVLSGKVVFSSDRNIVKIGKDGLDLKNMARDEGVTVDALVARRNAETAKVVKAAKGEK
jgi:hypothetical protein